MKPNLKRASLVGALFICSSLLIGWADDLEDIKNKVEFIKSIQAEFTQEKHLEMLEDYLVSRGVLYFETPHSLRWEYTAPVRSVLLMENKNIQQYIQAGNNMVAQKSQNIEAMRVFLQDICLWMMGEFEANPDLEAEMTPDRRILLKPAKDNAMAQMIQWIELRLTETPGVIESVKIYEDSNNYTIIRFHDTKINHSIKRDIFIKLNPDEIIP